MPPKTFKCVICGEEVTKPKSYAYKDGRACRIHDGVQEHHDKSEQERIAKSTRKELKRKERTAHKAHMWAPSPEDQIFMEEKLKNSHYCHVCGKTDRLTPQEFMFEHMVDVKQFSGAFADLLHSQLMGDREKTESNVLKKKLLERSKKVVIPCERPKKFTFRVDNRVWKLIELGLLNINACGECRDKHKLVIAEWYSKQLKENQEKVDERFKKMLAGDTAEALKITALMGRAVEPALDEAIKQREIDQTINN